MKSLPERFFLHASILLTSGSPAQTFIKRKELIMKKVIAFFAPVLFLVACGGGVDQYKPAIEELSANWDNATSAVSEFSKMISEEQTALVNLSNSLQVVPETMAKWDEATTSQFANIKGAAETSTNNVAQIAAQVNEFLTSWNEKSQQLQTLKDGLMAGKIEGDVQTQIAALSAAATDATAQLDSWKTKFTEIQAAAANVKQQFADFSQTTGLSDLR